jgi:hypothetical protein
MTPELRTYPVVDSLIGLFADWLKHRRDVNEACGCDASEYARIAHELGVSTRDLDTLVKKGPHASDELPKMLSALGIDERAIARTQPMVLWDMERVCASCQHKQECNQDLAKGTAVQDYGDYCGNAATIDALKAEKAN